MSLASPAAKKVRRVLRTVEREDIRPQPVQEQFLASRADICIFGGAAGGGKALAADTPIPTPGGWTSIGELAIGDSVFGMNGQPIRVLATSGIMADRPCYRMELDDGSSFVADSEHLWLTYDKDQLAALTRRDPEWRAKRRAKRVARVSGRKSSVFTAVIQERNRRCPTPALPLPVGDIRTTRELAETLRAGGRANHAIPVSQPAQYPEAMLPLDPYLMGVWLGDGTEKGGSITTADQEIVQAFLDNGFRVSKWSGPYAWGVYGLQTQLRSIGVFGNKHVPAIYLRGSPRQRLALLQGLMDTDGTACESGAVEFTSTNRGLAAAVQEIACSLGWRATVCVGRATLYGKDCGPKYRVKFLAKQPAFRLPRKLVSQKQQGFRRTTCFRYLVACEPVASVPVCCITVDSPDGMFLAGRTFVPTHNSWSLLMEASRFIHLPQWTAALFRRTYPEITAPGGMWPESMRIYAHLGGKPNSTDLSWRFPSGATIKFAHLQHETDILKWLGAQIALIGVDQMETFPEAPFWYLLSRNRSTCGVRPYIRATANPRPGWLADLLAWWIDQSTGYPIPGRAGVLRWFVRRDDLMEWADTRGELLRRFPGCAPKSLTFVPAKLTDNQKLMEADPGYLANLQALPRVAQERLLGGNWLIGDVAGEWPADYFGPHVWFDDYPPDLQLRVMALDPSKGRADKPGDYSAWVMLGVDGQLNLWADADLENTRPVEPLQSQPGRSIVTDGIDLYRQFGPSAVLVETNQFQELVATALQRHSAAQNCPMPLYTLNNSEPKVARIRSLGTYLAQRRLRIRNTRGGRMLVQQLRDFPTGAHDDAPDALAMAVRMADYMLFGGGTEGGRGVQVLRA